MNFSNYLQIDTSPYAAFFSMVFMRLINLTPEELRCPMGDCPAVYKDENGRLFIIGENITIVPEELKGKIGSHERLIAIEPAFFRQISEFQENDR